MNTIFIDKAKLLVKLKENRERHREKFLKAQEGYRAEVIEQLDKALKDTREGRKICTHFRLEAPQDQTPDYDRAIEMLDWSLDDKIELTSDDFRQYVRDEWHWKRDWGVSNAMYLAKSK